ncbi:T9SS type A sorting domain-containing protein [Flavobacterium paronense]|uniref:T9SS type A sorting domain-containing protein n=1 Tax=Flavobacterium paronense TaxID=1392775 RepID=A0ABV5GHI9_9FLAO|nr:T9SS type A sorting domain-containing protein [Flavobacterium paronense]MDN3676435.1 T9SS type A sorting domain-containing protein [Flavobacterium paronense]
MKRILLFTTMLFTFGATAQLRLVKEINNVNSSAPGSFYEYNGRLFFTALTGSSRYVFATDGTTTGTVNIRFDDPNTGALVNNPDASVNFYTYNSELFFDARRVIDDHAFVTKLIGTSNAAVSLYDVSNVTTGTASVNSRLGYSVGLNNKLIFSPIIANNQTSVEPYVTDLATPANSGLLKNIFIATNSGSYPTEFTVLGTNCFFSATDDNNGRELWKTDGTGTGTVLYLDMNTGASSSDPDLFNVLGSQLTFVATHPTLGRELFKTNGSGSLTLIKDINTTGDSNPTNVKIIGTDLYFSANNGTIGQELWKSNGNNIGTVLIKDINPSGDSNPSNFTQVGSLIFFLADDGVNGIDLWKTDGTNAGTSLVKNVVTGTKSIQNLTAYNGKLYFIVFDSSTSSREMWVSDGTVTGTQMVLATTFGPRNLYVFGDELFMSAIFNNTVGVELCAYKDPALNTIDFSLNENTIKLFPNPSQNYFELSTKQTVEKVEVYSVLGQLVKSFKAQNQYSISDLSKGSYIVKIATLEGTSNKTLLIE